MTAGATDRATVLVIPAGACTTHRRLLTALEAAEPVRFAPAGPPDTWAGAAALLAIGPEGAAAVASAPAGPPTLVAGPAAATSTAGVDVALSDDAHLPAVLRSARLTDRHARTLPAAAGDTVLARIGDAPAWTRGADGLETIGDLPEELGPDEALRERLAPGRCLSLLALVQFLRRVAGPARWQAPPLRAAFIFDDPNLHWPSYGHLRYRDLLAHATAHGYHVSIAMVPLDGRLAHPGVVRLFRGGREHLSICIHGNDHTGPELGRPTDDAEALSIAHQALRRAAAFERRSGIEVSRVMVPPHERLSEPVARALRATGFDGACTTRPYPWLAPTADVPWLSRPADAGPLVGWQSTDVVAGGLPMLLRAGLGHPHEDLVLRAFLGQPLIVYGHHQDLRGGLDRLAETAAAIDRLGAVRWASLSAIARGGADTRPQGATLEVRLRGPRNVVALPAGTERVRVDFAATPLPAGGRLEIARDREAPVAVDLADGTPQLPVAGHRNVTFTLAGPAPRPPTAAIRRGRSWPVMRRLASEGRDRMHGLLAR